MALMMTRREPKAVTPCDRHQHALLAIAAQLILSLALLAVVVPPVEPFLECRRSRVNVIRSSQRARRQELPPLRSVIRHDNGNDVETRNSGEQEAPSIFVLPIFPLRQRVKLPGESLTLNLYEDRYLAMAEWILMDQKSNSNKNPSSKRGSASAVTAFGALYASDKPQIVSDKGKGPIVPLLSQGDVGVVFPVETFQEAMIDTLGGNDRRRRIRIVGTGVSFVAVATNGAVVDTSFALLLQIAYLHASSTLSDLHRSPGFESKGYFTMAMGEAKRVEEMKMRCLLS